MPAITQASGAPSCPVSQRAEHLNTAAFHEIASDFTRNPFSEVQGVCRGGFLGKTALSAFQLMLRARALDDKLAALYRAGRIPGGVYLGKGQEALSVAAGLVLQPGDVYAPTIRDTAGRLAFGETVEEALRTWLGSALGPMRGRDGNIHRGRPRDGYLPMISHLGAMISVVNGTLMAKRMKGNNGGVGVACIGDGATSTGAFHEGLNQAAVERLPLVLVIANNQYAYSTPNHRQFACESLADRAVGYGVTGRHVDGIDLLACLQVVGQAVQAAREGRGPQLVVAELLRLCGHGEHDDGSYIDPALKNSLLGRDCLHVAEINLLLHYGISTEIITALKQQARGSIERAVSAVQREPQPAAETEDWTSTASARDSLSSFAALPPL